MDAEPEKSDLVSAERVTQRIDEPVRPAVDQKQAGDCFNRIAEEIKLLDNQILWDVNEIQRCLLAIEDTQMCRTLYAISLLTKDLLVNSLGPDLLVEFTRQRAEGVTKTVDFLREQIADIRREISEKLIAKKALILELQKTIGMIASTVGTGVVDQATFAGLQDSLERKKARWREQALHAYVPKGMVI